jgi:tRNA threonylcarbamoyladenosine modification (KEOPS) complex  Pcc1 subunit
MKITGTIKFPDPKSKETATRALQALAPDNLRSMESEISDNKISVCFQSEKIGSLIATVDDFLMNLKIAEEVEETLEKKK